METKPNRNRKEKLKKNTTGNHLEGEKKHRGKVKKESKSYYLPKSSYSGKGVNIRA